MGENSGAPAWEVVLPGGGPVPMGARKPCGKLIIEPGSIDEERLPIPSSVARILNAKQRAGDVHPRSRAELLHIVKESSKLCAMARIERLIDRREYSVHEVREKLRLDGYEEDLIETCIDRACTTGLVSDERFSESFIRSKVAQGWGMQRIERELGKRGIDTRSIAGWPYEFLDPENELVRALEQARRRRTTGARPYEKLVRYLCGRGFSLGVSRRAASQVVYERHDECDDGFIVDF